MATIRNYPVVSHVTSTATRTILQARDGRLVEHGVGAALWFRPRGTTLSEVPVDDLEFTHIFRVTTLDRQEVSIQTALLVRIVDPVLAAGRIDFALDVGSGAWVGRPLQMLQNRIAEIAQQFAARITAVTPLEVLLDRGLVIVQEAIEEGVADEPQLTTAGIAVVGVRVVAVRPEEDIERALQTRVREEIQAEADKATYDRRALAVDRERAIKENELNNQTELARRESELVELLGANERSRTEQELERERLRGIAEQEQRRLATRTRVEEIRSVAEAENSATSARLGIYESADLPALIAAVAPDVLAALPPVEALTITPDMLSSAITKVLAEVRQI